MKVYWLIRSSTIRTAKAIALFMQPQHLLGNNERMSILVAFRCLLCARRFAFNYMYSTNKTSMRTLYARPMSMWIKQTRLLCVLLRLEWVQTKRPHWFVLHAHTTTKLTHGWLCEYERAYVLRCASISFRVYRLHTCTLRTDTDTTVSRTYASVYNKFNTSS